MNLRVFVITSFVCIIGLGILFSTCSSGEKSATNQTTEAPCEQYKNWHIHRRFVVLECVENSRAAYVYDPVRKKCYFLTGWNRSMSLTGVTCDNLPVPGGNLPVPE